MKKIFILRASFGNKANNFLTVDSKSWHRFEIEKRTGFYPFVSLKEYWCELLVRKAYKSLKIYDFSPFTLEFPTISQRAVDCLTPILNDGVELLKLKIENSTQERFLFYVTTVCEDILDRTQSTISNDGWREKIMHHVFDKVVSCPYHVFRLPFTSSHIYVDDLFKECVEKNNLTGFDFMEVHPNEDPNYDFRYW